MSSRQPGTRRGALLSVLLLLAVAACACLAAAQAPAADRFAVAGVSEPQATHFLEELQEAVRKGDSGAIAAMTSFPLLVNGAPGPQDAEQLRGQYLAIFNTRVRNQILHQRAAELFVNARGVMIGSGALWFAARCDAQPPTAQRCTGSREVRIIAINNTTLKAETLR